MGLTENIVYVRPLSDVPKRAPAGKRLAAASSGKKQPKRSLEESLDQPLAE